jgi:hypothetical protein
VDIHEIAFIKLRLTPEQYNEMQPWQLFALLKSHNDDIINELNQTRLIMASITGKDPRYIIPLPGDFDDVPVMGSCNVKSMLKKAGLTNWLNG